MEYPFITIPHRQSTPAEFISFWQPLYTYSVVDYLYTESITKGAFTAEDIRHLFEWKNGMKVNGHLQKEKAITHVASNVEVVNSLKASFDEVLFKKNFGKMSAIWQIFLLHIIDPAQYPIFDQHVYRGFVFLKEKDVKDIPTQSVQKFALYEDYREFFKEKFAKIMSTGRDIDQALWAFGKFLKTNYARKALGLPLKYKENKRQKADTLKK